MSNSFTHTPKVRFPYSNWHDRLVRSCKRCCVVIENFNKRLLHFDIRGRYWTVFLVESLGCSVLCLNHGKRISLVDDSFGFGHCDLVVVDITEHRWWQCPSP